MTKKKKRVELDNIFAQMQQELNLDVVPFLRKWKMPTVKVRNQRQYGVIVRLEADVAENFRLKMTMLEVLDAYIVTNRFVVELLDPIQLDNCMALIISDRVYNQKTNGNILIGASALFTLVEAKKLELKALYEASKLEVQEL